MSIDRKYDLIVTIINHGDSDIVMEAAKGAGATGGTVLTARGLGSKEAEKFFGISIQPEKEVVLIVVKKDIKKDIMHAVCNAAGLNTKASGISFSLPIDDVIGIASIEKF
ncbi:hypothetical protein EDD66_10616 [Mobilisporobacter senegalensis]|uniref:Nitrogen regulatory protein P-II family n=1 Tax=Mobilisporobacter senegalensis TaxID=1329262 RepID=A0A3N1XMF7_9FIRM|nr:P-II family nitrogen regulator [Mobilisporobacter senegalensis]ROR27321.1 hypothetical protein EDD66_10616 [Mobilisporobacter senegalensis]